jgi:hypothetical protein
MVEKDSIVRRNTTICQARFCLSTLPYSSPELLRRINSPAADGGALNAVSGVLFTELPLISAVVDSAPQCQSNVATCRVDNSAPLS